MVFPRYFRVKLSISLFSNPTNLIPELASDRWGVTLAAHGPQCQRRSLCCPILLSAPGPLSHEADTCPVWSLAPWCHPLRCHLSLSDPQLVGPLSIFCCGISSSPCGAFVSSWGTGPRGFLGPQEMWGFSLTHTKGHTHVSVTAPCLLHRSGSGLTDLCYAWEVRARYCLC